MVSHGLAFSDRYYHDSEVLILCQVKFTTNYHNSYKWDLDEECERLGNGCGVRSFIIAFLPFVAKGNRFRPDTRSLLPRKDGEHLQARTGPIVRFSARIPFLVAWTRTTDRMRSRR